MTVEVGVSVGVNVIVEVGVSVGVNVIVEVGVSVGVNVTVEVGVSVGVNVIVEVGVSVGVSVIVEVGVSVGVGVMVGVAGMVFVGVTVTVSAAAVWVSALPPPPSGTQSAGCANVGDVATETADIPSRVDPAMIRSNMTRRMSGSPRDGCATSYREFPS